LVNTITDVQAFEAHLEEIRQQGFATDHEEYEDNVCCVAVPIYDHKEEVVAALGVSGPVNRMTLERESEIVAITQRIGTALSKQLSFR
jgi:DNA-binding IclR family transcriptional regulator